VRPKKFKECKKCRFASSDLKEFPCNECEIISKPKWFMYPEEYGG